MKTKSKIYLLVGTPGSGKTWVCNQLKNQFDHLAHDDFAEYGTKAYLNACRQLSDLGDKPVLIETPFSVSQILEPLEKAGYDVTPVFIIESEEVTTARYELRENKPIPKGHISRINTYIDRARELKAFSGSSTEVLAHMKGLK